MKSIELPILFYGKDYDEKLEELGIEQKCKDEVRLMTFYSIYAIAPEKDDKTFIYIGGNSFVCTLKHSEVKEKLKLL